MVAGAPPAAGQRTASRIHASSGSMPIVVPEASGASPPDPAPVRSRGCQPVRPGTSGRRHGRGPADVQDHEDDRVRGRPPVRDDVVVTVGLELRSPTWRAGVAARSAIRRRYRARTEPGSARCAATLRVVDIGPEPQPRTAAGEPGAGTVGPRHRRAAARAIPPVEFRADPGRGRIDALRARHVDVAEAQLFAVVQERRPPLGQEQDRGGARDGIAGLDTDGGRQPGDVARLVVVRQHGRRPARVAERGLALRDRRPDRDGRPRRSEQGPVEDEVPIGREAGGGLDRAVEQLADGHPAGRLVEDRPEAADELREVGLVPVVQVDLAVPGRPPRPGRVGSQPGVLQEGVEDVEPEPVDAACEPAADHRELGRLDARRPPVQLRLLGEERVVVELRSPRLPLPARAAEERDPVVRWQRRTGVSIAGGIAPQVPVGVRAGAAGARRDEPGVGVAGVVHDQVEHDPDPAPVRLRDEAVEVRLRPEERIDPFVVADVVAEIEPGDG